MSSYKQQYDHLLADERLHAFNYLHTEDAFVDLPPLEVEDQASVLPQ